MSEDNSVELILSILTTIIGGAASVFLVKKMVDALDAAGVHHEGAMYSEGGHALMKPHAPETDYWCMSVIEFLKDYLD